MFAGGTLELVLLVVVVGVVVLLLVGVCVGLEF
jgi:hypothetical protein